MTSHKISKFYIITIDTKGKIHRFVSIKALMHADLIFEFDIDFEEHTLLKKGFILTNGKLKSNYDIRKTKKKKNER